MGLMLLFNGAGIIAQQEGTLMLEATALMLIVIVPVLFLLFFFAWRYRATNTKAAYMPDWQHSKMDELIWWAIPIEIILVLAALAWSSAHSLDPYRALNSSAPPVVVQVVSLNWKWLFIYPAQGVATVNYLAIPENTPINFQLTSDAPMNAFWIPAFGGQEMVMPGMVTQLHLMSSKIGTYRGLSSNFSGDGFAGMQFPVVSMTQADFNQWVAQAKQSTSTLDWALYQKLSAPSENNPPTAYALGDPNLYTKIVAQFMALTPTSTMQDMNQ